MFQYGNKIAKEVDYPIYTTDFNITSCRNVTNPIPLNVAKTFGYNLNGDDNALKSVVANYGPVAISIAITTNSPFWQYKSGIFSDPACPSSPLDKCSGRNHGK